MLENLLIKKKKDTEEKIGKKGEYLEKILSFQQEIDGLTQEISDRKNIQHELQQTTAEKENKPLKFWFKVLFSREYRENLKKLQGNFLDDGQLPKMQEQLQQKEEEYRKIQTELSNISALETELHALDNPNYAIKAIIKENPQLLENEEFMIDLVNKNPRAIILDKTNSKNVFATFFQKALDIAEEYYDQVKDDVYESPRVNLRITSIREMLNELKQPNNVERSLPHVYLYESIKDSIQGVLKENDYACISFTANECCYNFNNINSRIDPNLIRRITELYNDENSIVYYHETHTANPENYRYQDIFRNGLLLQKEYGEDLSRTTISQKDMNLNDILAAICNNGESIILSIPKDASSIGLMESGAHNMILPQYVVGAIHNDHKGNIIWRDNDVPLSERTNYPNKLPRNL